MMNDLVERYVYQVGRYLPANERKEIQAELRSQIQDQLDDRYPGTPAQEDVAAILQEWGDPRTLAASYSNEQYLVGPDLYPAMMRVLRRGWIVVPSLVVLAQLASVFLSGEQSTLTRLTVEIAFAMLQGIIFFSAAVVLVFAVLQREGVTIREKRRLFHPQDLPPVDDPASIDYAEVTFGMALGIFFVLILLYFLSIGGLTLSLNFTNPGEVLAVPQEWLIALIFGGVAQLILQAFVLFRNRWTVPTMLAQVLVGLFSGLALYAAILQPIEEAFLPVPSSDLAAMSAYQAEIAIVVIAAMQLLGEVPKLIRMVRSQRG
jgi:hypothetical protein